MAKAIDLSVRGFWIAAAILYGIVFWVHQQVYVTADAIATSAGAVIAGYLAGWGLWFTANRIWGPERVPARRYSITVLACLVAALNSWPLVSKLLA